MDARAARLAWAIFAAVAAALALLAVAHWVEALLSGRPVIYGEGAVANAALLFRDGTGYRDTTGAVAANYPPLYIALASLGDPFRVGRALTMLSAIAVGAMVAWRARDGGPLAAAAIGLGWLALAPVGIWGAAVKPDLLAVALTFGGVAVLERSRAGSGAIAAGALLALAVWAKPTALLPAAAVLAWAFVALRPAIAPASAGFAATAAIATLHAATIGIGDVWRHVVTWNALPWSTEQALLVLVLAAAVVGIVVAALTAAGAVRGIALAYLVGAWGVVLLAGREGATINYLLDLAAATAFAAARGAPRLRASAGFAVAASAQLAIGLWLLAPFGIVPGREATTGAWGQPERMEAVRALGPGDHLVEDSGLLMAAGRRPVIDDLFLWRALAASERVGTAPLFDRVLSGELASVVSEVDLTRLDQAPAYERARWHPGLVALILEHYRLERSTGRLWVYRPRR